MNFAFWVSHVPRIEIRKAFLWLAVMELEKKEKDRREVYELSSRQKKIESVVFVLGIVSGLVLCFCIF